MAKASVSRPPPEIEALRGQLFHAQAIINCVGFAVASRSTGLQETDISFAMRAASEIIDNTAAAMEVLS
jgi:hypothetical protein